MTQQNRKKTILVADDDSIQRELICTYLLRENYRIVTSSNGLKAWAVLKASPEKFDVVLMDRKMPGMGGMDILRRMKRHYELKMVPVIILSGMTEPNDIIEGLQAGVDYYITKPFLKDMLLAIIKTAISGYQTYKSVWKDIRQTTNALSLMRSGEFVFSSPEEVKGLASLLAGMVPNSNSVAIGLWELLINAIEHGNLGITYAEKSELMERDEWLAEINRRMKLPENISKRVVVRFESNEQELRFIIKDEGNGFDWRLFLNPDPERAFDLNGRGIQLARSLSFEKVVYIPPGNKVVAVIKK